MTERKARARTGESRFFAPLRMTISFRNCQRKARARANTEADPCGMTARKATTAKKALVPRLFLAEVFD
jgi:hypothetical protein